MMRKYSCKAHWLFVNYLFTILNIFENKKGITKILIYSSAIEILNQISVIFFEIIIQLVVRSDLCWVLHTRV